MASSSQNWHPRTDEAVTCEINHVESGPNDWLRINIGRNTEIDIILDHQGTPELANLGICMIETGVAIQKMGVKKDTNDKED